jgi:osmoprotectant transport system ATP-binding protein
VIDLDRVSKRYAARIALEATTLSFARGKTSVLIGPSGCGKSTLIRMIIGLVHPDSGTVTVGGEALSRGNVERIRHDIGYVIQDGGLFPHLTAYDNVTLLANFLKRPKNETRDRVHALARLVRIPDDALQRFPQQLSGGQRQRIGVMRALALDPPVLLLDEPLGALDPITRYELQEELKNIFAALQKTVVMVTHDMGEAMHFGDDIVMMRDGRIVQRGTARDLVEHPAEPYVLEFIRAQRVAVTEAGG